MGIRSIVTLPEPPADGSPIDPSAFPSTVPGYLIRLVAELRVAGQVVAIGGPFTMGQELVSTEGTFDPIRGWQFAEDNTPVAGEYRATAIDAAGIPTSQIQDLQENLTVTKSALEEAGTLNGINPDGLVGGMLYSTVLSYFAINDAVERRDANEIGVLVYRRPSFGSFTGVAQVQFLFGIPGTVSFSGLEMDIDRMVSIAVSKDNKREVQIAYIQQSGFRKSAYEHLIPELMFTDAEHPGEAISAVKALVVAGRQGQQIFILTKDNAASILPQLNIALELKAEIQDAAASGKVVTVSQGPVTVGSWTGVGYTIIDPETGSGAFKISGGVNGAFFQGLEAGFLFILIIGIIVASFPTFASLIVASGLFLGQLRIPVIAAT